MTRAHQLPGWQSGRHPFDPLSIALILAATLPLALRRIWPLAVLAVATVATSGYLIVGYPYGPILVAFAVAVYTVAAWLPVRTATLAAILALAGLLGHGLRSGQLLGLVPGSAWVVLPFAVGRVVRLGREAAARDRAGEVRRNAYEARLHIAQEVHDIVGHGLAAIHMQAEIALHLLPKRPEQAESALSTISRTSKEALDELRSALAVVRHGGPLPGLAALPDLAARVASAGVQVSVTVQGQRRELPSTVDLTAYRVAQEALTNVLRHAGPAATAQLRLDYGAAALTLDVTDTGRASSTVESGVSTGDGGHGIAGMRERVGALGGDFRAGPQAGGGFHVHARFPLPGVPDGRGSGGPASVEAGPGPAGLPESGRSGGGA
ncbi:MAG: sensor histidine kinase [Micromonosporaceae bacterium]|nr:sensor histidine kinase [Micromonosporaceae bacterium]